jgi:hypothetical protein
MAGHPTFGLRKTESSALRRPGVFDPHFDPHLTPHSASYFNQFSPKSYSLYLGPVGPKNNE